MTDRNSTSNVFSRHTKKVFQLLAVPERQTKLVLSMRTQRKKKNESAESGRHFLYASIPPLLTIVSNHFVKLLLNNPPGS